VIRDPIFVTDVVDHEGDGRLVSLFYIVGDYRPGDIGLQEGAGVAIHRIADLSALKITPFVRRAIESRLLPVIAAGCDEWTGGLGGLPGGLAPVLTGRYSVTT
jgi:hypothetical protein